MMPKGDQIIGLCFYTVLCVTPASWAVYTRKTAANPARPRYAFCTFRGEAAPVGLLLLEVPEGWLPAVLASLREPLQTYLFVGPSFFFWLRGL